MATGRDLEITAANTWTTPLLLNKGDSVSVSVKGSFTGVIKVRRWPVDYGNDPDAAGVAVHIGVAREYNEAIEAVDISAGTYYYQIGTDDFSSGTAYVNLQ